MAGLLYDQVCSLKPRCAMDNDLLGILKKSPVFEISNVVHLLPDWNDQRESSISKRPPDDCVWAEWKYVDSGKWEDRWSLGCLVISWDKEHLPDPQGGGADSDKTRDTFKSVFQEYEEFYRVSFFKRLDSTTNPKPSIRQGTLAFSLVNYYFCLKDEATKARTLGICPPIEQIKRREGPAAGWVPFGLMGMLSFYPDSYEQIVTPWPPFMAFSLLHCKNITTETIERQPYEKERHKRQGLPPKRSYKVLRLELPATLRPRHVTEAEAESEIKMRFHLCRGHFKNLQSDRYKAKGWHWWPAHWRGSRGLGRIDKTYELAPGP